jgi:hypothetical protein
MTSKTEPKEPIKPSHFIPFRKTAIVHMLCKDGALNPEQIEQFRELARIVEAYYHFQFHHKLETLKNAYFPFNPDLDVASHQSFSADQRNKHARCLTQTLVEVLKDANYEQISHTEILQAFEEESLFSLRLSLDFDDFEECYVFGRGDTIKTAEIPKLKFWKKIIEVPTYERVVLFMRFKEAGHFDAEERKKLNFNPGSIIIKIFKDMPHSDLEMLFPNTQLGMRVSDKLLLGVPAIGGAIPILITKVLPHVVLIFSVLVAYLAGEKVKQGKWIQAVIQGTIALFAIAAYSWRQWEKFKNRRLKYLKTLTESLYFRNLDNNAGVFFHLIDSAEEEESKEAILAYYFLLTEGPRDAESLDRRIEEWFAEKHQTVLDFEVDGALDKLIKLGLSWKKDDLFEVLPIADALRRVDELWDNFFDYPEMSKTCQLDESEFSSEIANDV